VEHRLGKDTCRERAFFKSTNLGVFSQKKIKYYSTSSKYVRLPHISDLDELQRVFSDRK
jgi:hypothetical protein